MTRAALWFCLAASYLAAPSNGYHDPVQTQPAPRPQLSVKPTDDFQVNGAGDHAAWKGVEWTPLQRRQADGHPYDARFKILYSKTGMYFLMDATDRKLTATLTDDFAHLWTEDVFVAAIRNGKHMGAGRPILPPMPYYYYKNLTDDDLKAVFAYLKSLPAISNAVPAPVGPAEAVNM